MQNHRVYVQIPNPPFAPRWYERLFEEAGMTVLSFIAGTARPKYDFELWVDATSPEDAALRVRHLFGVTHEDVAVSLPSDYR